MNIGKCLLILTWTWNSVCKLFHQYLNLANETVEGSALADFKSFTDVNMQIIWDNTPQFKELDVSMTTIFCCDKILFVNILET